MNNRKNLCKPLKTCFFKGYINDKGASTSVIVRKLGTLKELLPEHGPTRDDVMAWAKEEAKYDGLYAVCTELLDDDVSDILKVSEGRWQIEECFRIMKTDFSARPVYLQDENRIKAHFLICFLALTIYRFLEKKLDSKYTCEELLDTLKAMNFVEVQEQGFIPTYKREPITDALHDACGFRTNYQFITKSKMKTIQKENSLRFNHLILDHNMVHILQCKSCCPECTVILVCRFDYGAIF